MWLPIHLTDVMRLQIDHGKSWHWATGKPFRDHIKTIEDLYPRLSGRVVIATCVKDLGELVHYNKSASIGFIREKIDEGIHRIQRIEWIPCDLQKKAHFVQTSVWPFVVQL